MKHTLKFVIKNHNSATNCLKGEEALMDSMPLLPRLINGFVAPQMPATIISQTADTEMRNKTEIMSQS